MADEEKINPAEEPVDGIQDMTKARAASILAAFTALPKAAKDSPAEAARKALLDALKDWPKNAAALPAALTQNGMQANVEKASELAEAFSDQPDAIAKVVAKFKHIP